MDGDVRKFLAEFRRSPQSIGGIVPSSSALAEAMIAPIDFGKASTIVEFGPGTGVMTSVIARHLTSHHRYIGVELNDVFYKMLALRFPSLSFVNNSAENIREILDGMDIASADAVVCGLPWASLPDDLPKRILDATENILKPGAVFVTFAYVQGLVLPGAWKLRRALKTRFSVVKTTRTVWQNMPPAFAYICTK